MVWTPCAPLLASPRGERLPAQVAVHLNDAADDVMSAITRVSGCSALDDIELINVFLSVWVPYRIEAYIPNVVSLTIGRHVFSWSEREF